jgi:hypothetical protein
MRVHVPRVSRHIDLASFADLTPVPLLTVRPLGKGAALTFADDLDVATRRAIVERCGSSPDTDDLRGRAQQALAECQAFLNLEAPTNADALAQLRVLTRVVMSLTRLVLRRL